jgi:hypothetical protein
MARVIQEAQEATRRLRFTDALRRVEVVAALVAAADAVILLAALAAWQADLAGAWLRRNVLLADGRYPTRTALTVEGGPVLRVARGGPLEVTVRADPKRVVPSEVMFHLVFASAGDRTVQRPVGLAPGRADAYVQRFEVVSEPFHFHVTGNDARTDEVAVEVAEPPYLSDVNFHVTRPSYTHLGPLLMSAAQGTIRVPEHSDVAVRAVATKDLREAVVLLDNAPVGVCHIEAVPGADGSPRPRAVSGRFVARPSEPYRPALPLRFALTDCEGFANPRGAQYTVALVPDQAPTVQMALKGVGGQVSRQAVIPLEITARDDYGVQEIELEWTVLSAAGQSHRVGVRRLDPDEKEPAPLVFRWDLRTIEGAGPGGEVAQATVGDSLRLAAVVRDTLPPPGGPHSAVSNPVTIKIVPDEEVLAALVDSQRVMREQFRQAIVIQVEAREKTGAAAEDAPKPARLDDARRAASAAADLQQQVGDRVATVADRFAVILEQMENNRLGAEQDRRRIRERIVAPLKDLADGTMKRLAADLVAARIVTDGPRLAGELARLAAIQQDVLKRLEAVLGEMIKVENAQQVERGLRVIIDMSEQVRNLTKPGPGAAPAPGAPAPGPGAPPP